MIHTETTGPASFNGALRMGCCTICHAAAGERPLQQVECGSGDQMKVLSCAAMSALLLAAGAARAGAPGHYLFAWAGDPTGHAQDFIAVIDADPDSPGYGKLVASAASGVRTHQVHHTEYWMPAGGLLFANDHKAGSTVVMDLRDPLHPRVHAV